MTAYRFACLRCVAPLRSRDDTYHEGQTLFCAICLANNHVGVAGPAWDESPVRSPIGPLAIDYYHCLQPRPAAPSGPGELRRDPHAALPLNLPPGWRAMRTR